MDDREFIEMISEVLEQTRWADITDNYPGIYAGDGNWWGVHRRFRNAHQKKRTYDKIWGGIYRGVKRELTNPSYLRGEVPSEVIISNFSLGKFIDRLDGRHGVITDIPKNPHAIQILHFTKKREPFTRAMWGELTDRGAREEVKRFFEDTYDAFDFAAK